MKGQDDPPPWSQGSGSQHPVEAALSRALERGGLAVEITDAQGRVLYVNRAYEAMTGYFAREAVGRTPAELLRSDYHDPALYDAIWTRLMTGRSWQGDLVSRRKDGSHFVRHATVVPVLDAQGERTHIVAVSRETTAEERSQRRYRALVEETQDAVLVARLKDGSLLEANRAARALLGYGEGQLRSLRAADLCAAGQDELIAHAREDLVKSGAAWVPQIRLRTRDGGDLWAELRMAVAEVADGEVFLAIARDITLRVQRERELSDSYDELRRTHAQLMHSSKLAAVGQLAGGVAHEINNPASFAMVNLSLLQEQLAGLQSALNGAIDPRDVQGELEELSQLAADSAEGIRRITEITGDLARFARGRQSEPGPVDLAEVVRIACRMVQNEARHRAQLVVDARARHPVQGDASQLTQVLTNLLMNAAQAIEPGAAGAHEIRVTTRDRDEQVEICVDDTGVGIPEVLRERVFERFFTTRPPEEGTGMGLAHCLELLEAHGGSLTLAPRQAGGTRARVLLPRAPQPASRNTPLPARSTPPTALSQPPARPRVLLIDDDPLVLRTYQRALQGSFEVVTAEGGAEGLHHLEEGEPFDAVVCDVMMPDVDGPALYEIVAGTRPQLLDRIAFCTGGIFTERIREFVAHHNRTVHTKPQSSEELRALVDTLAHQQRQHGPASV